MKGLQKSIRYLKLRDHLWDLYINTVELTEEFLKGSSEDPEQQAEYRKSHFPQFYGYIKAMKKSMRDSFLEIKEARFTEEEISEIFIYLEQELLDSFAEAEPSGEKGLWGEKELWDEEALNDALFYEERIDSIEPFMIRDELRDRRVIKLTEDIMNDYDYVPGRLNLKEQEKYRKSLFYFYYDYCHNYRYFHKKLMGM